MSGVASDAEADADDWESHWTDFGDSAASNPAQAYRRRLLFRSMALRPGDRLVDIGSGQGDLVRDALDVLPSIDCLGLEYSASGIALAQVKSPTARFEQTDLLEGSPPPPGLAGWGTIATCSEVLEHIDTPEILLRNALSYLAPGAVVVVTVPAGPRSAFDRYIGHRRHFSRSSLERVMATAGLEGIRVQAAGFPFFNLYKLATIVRGKRLIADARPEAGKGPAPSGILAVFTQLFRANLSNSPFGWQLVATARVPNA